MKMPKSANRRHGLAVTGFNGGILLLGLLVSMTLAAWLMVHVQATTTGSEKAVDLALADTLNAILTNSACPKDLASIQTAAEGLFPIMHPEIIQMYQSRDEAALELEAERNWSLDNPGEEHARRMADPAYRDDVASGLAGLQFGIVLEP